MDQSTNDSNVILLQIGEIVRRSQPQRPHVLTPARYRIATGAGVALTLFGILISGAPGWLYLHLSSAPPAGSAISVTQYYLNLTALVVGLLCMGCGSILIYRRPKSRIGGLFWANAVNIFGPYDTRDILAMAYYAHGCAARARESSARTARRLLRMASEYLYCPFMVSSAARQVLSSPGPVGDQGDPRRVSHERMLLFFCCATFPPGGNLEATAWFQLSRFAKAAPPTSAGDIEHLTRLWCEVIYRFLLYERDRSSSGLSGLTKLMEEIATRSYQLNYELPKPAQPKSVLKTHREWVLAVGLIVVFWIGAFSFGRIWPQSLPGCLMAALVSSGAAVLAGWNLHASRKRAERSDEMASPTPNNAPAARIPSAAEELVEAEAPRNAESAPDAEADERIPKTRKVRRR